MVEFRKERFNSGLRGIFTSLGELYDLETKKLALAERIQYFTPTKINEFFNTDLKIFICNFCNLKEPFKAYSILRRLKDLYGVNINLNPDENFELLNFIYMPL
jgi:hypothetical protein